MSELGDVLELLHGARGRYRTVRATIRHWVDNDRSLQAFGRHAAERSQGGGGTFSSVSAGLADAPNETEAVIRLWLERPDRSREEYESKQGPTESRVTVVDGDTWWLYTPSWGAMSNHGDADHGTQATMVDHLFDPAPVIGGLDFDVLDCVSHRGRDAIRVRAWPRRTDDWGLHVLGLGADEHELLVDAERGVLLHALAIFEEQPYALFEVLEIAFDEVFPPATFVFEPPPGEIVRSPGGLELRQVTIERAAELAPFPVWIPSRVPEGWVLHVTFLPGQDRPPMAPTVSIHCAPETGAHQLTLTETPSGHQLTLTETPSGHRGWTAYGDWTVVERDGQELRVSVPDPPAGWLSAQVLLERDGTQIQITSDLDTDTLIGIAASLIPAPTEPPAFT